MILCATVADWVCAFRRHVIGEPYEFQSPQRVRLFEESLELLPRHGVSWECAFDAGMEMLGKVATSYERCVKLVRHYFAKLAPFTAQATRRLASLLIDAELPRSPRGRAVMVEFVVSQGKRFHRDTFFSGTLDSLYRAAPEIMAEVALVHGNTSTAYNLLCSALERKRISKKKLRALYLRWCGEDKAHYLGKQRLTFLSGLANLHRLKREPLLVH